MLALPCNFALMSLRKYTHMQKLEAMILNCIIHSLRFYLSHSTAIHTNDIWYRNRFIDGEIICKTGVV